MGPEIVCVWCVVRLCVHVSDALLWPFFLYLLLEGSSSSVFRLTLSQTNFPVSSMVWKSGGWWWAWW